MIFIISEGSEAYAAFYCKVTALGKIIIILKLSFMSNLARKQIVLLHVWFILMSFMSLGYQF
jgi:hypothetical protein